MHKKFDHKTIEEKWRKSWQESGIYNVDGRDASKEKEYVLVELPYPSGNLHIGHWYAFAVPDIYVRAHRMMGKQVLFPMGFDAFGLPAENAAIKRDLDPKEWTQSNIAHMRTQLASMGNAFSWDKAASTTDPAYYRWTQWMFTKFFEKDIAYRGKGIVNWCPSCNTVLANEQVMADDTCERCDTKVEKKEMDEWKMRITQYADRLVDDLDKLDWPESIKESQRNWIGRSTGAQISFTLSTGDAVAVFTTRPDTLFGATYMVLAPEHVLVEKLKDYITNWDEVDIYRKEAGKKDEMTRTAEGKGKTGVRLEGVTATNPANSETIPVFIADYVLAGYGTGAIMAVPAHDERDYAFAKKFNLPIKQVISPIFNRIQDIEDARDGVYGLIKNKDGKYLLQHFKNKDFYWLPGGGVEKDEDFLVALEREIKEETGYQDFKISSDEPRRYLFDFRRVMERRNSRNQCHVYTVELTRDTQHAPSYTEMEQKNGLEMVWLTLDEIKKLKPTLEPARVDLIVNAIEHEETGSTSIQGILIHSGKFDGMDSEEAKAAITKEVGGTLTNTYRLRDWSVGRQRYWGVPIPIVYDPEGKAHAIPEEHLPWLLPTDVDFRPTGEPPLAKSKELEERTEKIFGKGWTPEVETMDTFVDSSWYFLRYIDNENTDIFASLEKQKEWMPIDIYFGGAEHTTMHLLYSRFWQKALHDLSLVTVDEPYTRRLNRGLVLGPDGNKMSKSKGNVVDPDEQVARLGADTVKMYLAFMGPYGEVANYPWDMGGIAGIRRFLERVCGLAEHRNNEERQSVIKLLHKTVKKVQGDIEAFKFNTAISAMMIFVNTVEKEGLSDGSYRTFLTLLAPFAPFLTEELWHELGEKESIHLQTMPEYDEVLAKDDMVTIGVQINGKARGSIELSPEASEEAALTAVRADASLAKRLAESEIKKVIYVPGRILNLITG